MHAVLRPNVFSFLLPFPDFPLSACCHPTPHPTVEESDTHAFLFRVDPEESTHGNMTDLVRAKGGLSPRLFLHYNLILGVSPLLSPTEQLWSPYLSSTEKGREFPGRLCCIQLSQGFVKSTMWTSGFWLKCEILKMKSAFPWRKPFL